MTKALILGATAAALATAAFARPEPTKRPGLILPPKAHPAPRAVQGGVRADVNDPKAMIAALNKAFEDFKEANDERITSKADAVVDAKLSKVNEAVGAFQTAIDELNRRIAAMTLGNGTNLSVTPERVAYSQAFDGFFRRGAGVESLKELGVKAQLTRQSDPDGGFAVTPEIEATIDRVLGEVSAMRMLATVRSTGASTYKKRVGLGGASSGWVGENETRSETNTPRVATLEYPTMTLYAEPEATEEMLEDADFDIAEWLAGEVDIEFGEQEGQAYVDGNGMKRPRGFLSYDMVEDDAWAWGKIGHRISGHATLINSIDPLISLSEALKQGFRGNASWLANRKTWSAIRQLKDGNNNYLWQPSTQVGKPSTLLGYPNASDDNMPDVAAGSYPLAFGDFKRGYLILDRRGVRVLRNPFKNSGFVTFYTTKRVSGGVQHFQAIKLLKVSA